MPDPAAVAAIVRLIDDFVVYGAPEDYVHFSEMVQSALPSSDAVVLSTDSHLIIEVSLDNEFDELFTSLQNQNNDYFSKQDWEERSILRVVGSESVLTQLGLFLHDVSGRSVECLGFRTCWQLLTKRKEIPGW